MLGLHIKTIAAIKVVMYPKPKGNQDRSKITAYILSSFYFLCSLYGLRLEEPGGIALDTLWSFLVVLRQSMADWEPLIYGNWEQ